MYAVVRVASGRAMTKSQRRRSRSSRRSRGSRRSGRRYGNVLGVGQSFLTDHLKLHRFSDSLRITDLTNAGKRGKKVREMTVQAGTLDSTRSDAVLRRAAEHILDMDYDQAKAALTAPSKKLQVHERQLRGIDVEPGATTFKLSKTFPNGTIVSIKSSPHAFQNPPQRRHLGAWQGGARLPSGHALLVAPQEGRSALLRLAEDPSARGRPDVAGGPSAALGRTRRPVRVPLAFPSEPLDDPRQRLDAPVVAHLERLVDLAAQSFHLLRDEPTRLRGGVLAEE